MYLFSFLQENSKALFTNQIKLNNRLRLKYKNTKGYLSYAQVINNVEKTIKLLQINNSKLLHSLNINRSYILSLWEDKTILLEDMSNIYANLMFQLISNWGVKPIWISEDLAKAFDNSYLPPQLPILERPIKSGLLIFPCNFKVNGLDNFYLESISFLHLKKTDSQSLLSLEDKCLDRLTSHLKENESIIYILAVVLNEKNKKDTMFIPCSFSPPTTLDKNWSNSLKIMSGSCNLLSETICENVGTKIISFVLQTLIYLNNLPPQESAKYLASPQSSGGKYSSNHCVLTPQILGENFRIKTESQKSLEPALVSAGGSSHGGGYHASPAPHWRRGHYRMQPYGSRENPSYKPIWIEPMMINFH